MGLIKVKNLNGTSSETKCTEGAYWIDHWANYMNYSGACCSRRGCSKTAEVGGHVKKVQSQDNTEYIVPLCNGCNQLSSDEIYEVQENRLVPVSHEKWPSGKSCKIASSM